MSDPRLILQLFQQFLEPRRVAAALKSNYYFLAAKLFIKGAHVILFMLQLHLLNLTIFSCQITDRLFASMKVDSDIYSHGRLLLLTQTVTASLPTLGWMRLLHTIRRLVRTEREARTMSVCTNRACYARCADGTSALP